MVSVGSRPVPEAGAHGQHSFLCPHDWARRVAVVRFKACRTVDRPRTPPRHTGEGDAAVRVCVERAGLEAGVCMLVEPAGHDGSHG